MDLKEFLNRNWAYSYTRRMTYQKMRLYRYGFWKPFEEIFGYKQYYQGFRLIKGDCFAYYDFDEHEKLKEIIAEKFVDKKFIIKKLKGLLEKVQKDFDNHLKFSKKLPQKLSNLSNKEIVKILDKFYKQENIISPDTWIIFGDIEVALTNAIKDLAKSNGIPAEEAKDMISNLSNPMKIIPLDMERLSLLKVAALPKEKQERALLNHWKIFSYMPMYDINYQPYILEHFRKELTDLMAKLNIEQIKKEIEEIKQKYKARKFYYSKLIKKFKGKREFLYLLKFFANYSHLKDYKPFVRDKSGFYIRNTFLEVAKRLNLNLSQALFLNEQEIRDALLNGKKFSEEELNKRINNSIYFSKREETYFITDEEEIKKIENIFSPKEETKELKGLGVSKGFAKGIVSIILSNNDFSKFKEGKILVASATRPDYVPLMKKAIAIITDEGGMLSHAAIVSRELGKPCVVGTGKGTRLLKNGDEIEVDANKGIVKILKNYAK
jgi:phosphohistidine swiveling domain-containing protein